MPNPMTHEAADNIKKTQPFGSSFSARADRAANDNARSGTMTRDAAARGQEFKPGEPRFAPKDAEAANKNANTGGMPERLADKDANVNASGTGQKK